MRTRIGWLALLTVGMLAAPTGVWGQEPTGIFLPPSVVRGLGGESGNLDYSVPQADPVFPVPLYSPRPESGGFFFDGEFIYWRQTNPVKSQLLAVRGFVNTDGASPIPQPPGTFNGNMFNALNTDQVSHPDTFIPGYKIGLGYRFPGGLEVEGNYWHLFNVRVTAGAAILPPGNQIDPNLANTFLYSPVFNFPIDWAGPAGATTVAPANPLGQFGIWNGASEMEESWQQRFEKYELKFRIPIWETEYDPVSNPDHIAVRTYGMAGIRHIWEWERFWWRTVHANAQGIAGPTDVAMYTNILSQEMYGAMVGWGAEFYAGHGFSLSLDVYATVYMDFGREYVNWLRGDEGTEAKASRKVFTPVPETEANLNLWWYPIEGVQCRIGYNLMVLYNTFYQAQMVSTQGTFTPPASFIPGVTPQGTVQPGVPILGLGNFNFENLNPLYKHMAARFIDGLNIGIGFIF